MNGGVNDGVNDGVNELLGYIISNPGQKTSEMSKIFDFSQRTLERHLKHLKDTEKIEFRGAPKTGGYYTKKTN